MHLVYASLNPNFHFKGLYASPNQSFLSFEGIFNHRFFYCFSLNAVLTTAKSRYTIYTGVLYLHNGFVRSKKKRVREVLSSKGNGIYSGGFQSGNRSYVVRRYVKSNNGVKGRYVTCRKSMSRYHAWSLNPISHCQTAVNFKNNVRAAT